MFFKIVAVIVVFFGVFMLFKVNKTIPEITVVATDSIVTQKLVDGTVVAINENSTIAFPEEFKNKQRVVKLEGEAFFEVAHDSTQPFIVDAQRGYIEVLGTKFNVNTNSERYIEVRNNFV